MTGASSGLGREFALALAVRGYPVLAVARRDERLRALADEVVAGGGRLEPLVADLATTDGIDALLARAAELQVELLVNNAGVASYGPFVSAPTERERALVRLNVEAIVALRLPELRRALRATLCASEDDGSSVAAGPCDSGRALFGSAVSAAWARRAHRPRSPPIVAMAGRLAAQRPV